MLRADNLTKHPIQFLRELRQRYGDDLKLSFSRYTYKRRIREDARESFQVSISDVNRAWLSQQLVRLAPGEELALESRVRVARRLRHIPMIDFHGMKPGQLAAVMEVLP